MDAPRHAQLLFESLPHDAELVVGVQALHHLSLRGEAEDADPIDLHLLARGCDAPELALVGTAHPPTGHHFVPSAIWSSNGGMEVAEGGAELAHEPFDILGAALAHRPVGLAGDVAIEDLVGNLQVPLVADLLDVAPEDGLVLFFRRHASPPSQPASPGGLASSTVMMPPIRARRITEASSPRDR